MKDISYEESLLLDEPLYIDVRAPGEYFHDHVPGAVNLPIFNDEERKEIGTMYKKVGKDEAMVRGAEIGGTKISGIVSEINKYRDRRIVIYCARGGMRSGSVASLINSLGIEVYRLSRGYKGYRNYIVDKMENISVRPGLLVLQGLTGAGKTEIIRNIKYSIDLEGIAGHRSSLFGGIGLVQNTQKGFESLLHDRIKTLGGTRYTVIEGESRKIGNLHIPASLFAQMKNSPVILIDATRERRIEIILKEYTMTMVNEEKLVPILKSLTMKLGRETVKDLIALLTSGRLHDFVGLILEKYYDPLYNHSLNKIDYIAAVKNIDSRDAAREVESIAGAWEEKNEK